MLNLFKKKKRFKTQDIISCFGKLPCHCEFIKPKTIVPQIIALDNWYQQAYLEFHQAFGLKSKDLLKNIPTYHFLLSEPKPMIGSVYASCDSSNRYYPFVIARILENPFAQEFITTVPLLYENYFQASEQFFQQAKSYKNLNYIDEHLLHLTEYTCDSKKRVALEKVLTTLQTTSFNDYWQNPLDLAIIKDINSFFENVIQILKQPFHIGICLPLTTTNPLPFVTFYLQIFEILLTDVHLNWQVYWQQENDTQNARMLFTFQPLPHHDWQYLFMQHSATSNIYDPCAATTNRRTKTMVIPQSNLSLYEVIQIFAEK